MDGNSGDKAPSPMEMVLMAAGGCSAIDVVSIRKGRQDVVDCEEKLTSERREEAPRLFTHINLHFIVTGRDLKMQRLRVWLISLLRNIVQWR